MMADRAARICALLDEEPGLTGRELAERLGERVTVLLLVLPKLEERGLVVHEANRWYSLR